MNGGECLSTTGSMIFLSSAPADSAVRARAADAVDCETPEKSLPCIMVSCPIVRGGGRVGRVGRGSCCSSSLINDSRARHFLSNRRHRSQDSDEADHVH